MAGGGGSTEVFQQDQASADNGQGAYTPPTTQAPALCSLKGCCTGVERSP